MRKKTQAVIQPFRRGQIWEVADTNLLIAEVGKILVHYKRYKTTAKGVPTSLSAKEDLEKYLKQNKAILVQE
jgi:hypothetical protein